MHMQDTTTPSDGDVVHAGFWKRWAALFLDQLILGAGFYGLLFALAVIFSIAGGVGWLEDIDTEDPQPVVVALYAGFMLAYYVVAGLYFSLFESSRHQATPGKMALGIKVVDGRGQRLSFGRALGRWVAATLSYVTLYIGFLMAAFTERKRALHDMIADTLVVDRWAYTGFPERQRRDLGGCLIAAILAVVLLLGVAILGILAAIALPAYNDYTQRARVVEALAATSRLDAVIVEFRATHGTCPSNGDGGIGPADAIGGGPATRVTVGSFEDGACGYELEIGGTGHEDLDGGLVWKSLDAEGTRWHCASDIRDSLLPEHCRG